MHRGSYFQPEWINNHWILWRRSPAQPKLRDFYDFWPEAFSFLWFVPKYAVDSDCGKPPCLFEERFIPNVLFFLVMLEDQLVLRIITLEPPIRIGTASACRYDRERRLGATSSLHDQCSALRGRDPTKLLMCLCLWHMYRFWEKRKSQQTPSHSSRLCSWCSHYSHEP